MKKIFIFFVVLLGCANAKAQLSIAPEVGMQITNVSLKSDSLIGVSPDSRTSYRAGVNLGVGLIKNLTLHVGGFFSVKGYNISTLGITGKARANYIEVPVYLNYSVVKFAGNEIFIGAGPYFGYCLGGKSKVSGSIFGMSFNEEADLKVGSDASNDDITPVDFGINADAGIVTKLGFYGRVHYGMGLANTVPGGNSSNSAQNRVFGISVGYQFKF